jgi:predicted ribosome quality control (RQC) complex YloA/Tae2 family protein
MVAEALAELAVPIATGRWEPSIAWQGDAALEYAAFPLHQYPDAEVRTYASMSEVIRIGTARQVRVARFDRSRRPLMESLSARAEQTRRKRSSLERSLASADDAEELRSAGELLLANAHVIEPGVASFEWEGRRIDLYPTLSAVENAQSYFKRYADSRDARRVVPPLLEAVEFELAYLDEMVVHVEMADSEQELAAIRRELQQAGVVRPSGKTPVKAQKGKGDGRAETGAYRRVSVPGAELLIGRSAVGNDTITFRMAQSEDLWFHARGVPGAHVVLRVSGRSPVEEQIEAAARAAASHSAARDEGRVEVDYTARKYVRRVPGAAPGRVTYSRASTISVAPTDLEDVARSA